MENKKFCGYINCFVIVHTSVPKRTKKHGQILLHLEEISSNNSVFEKSIFCPIWAQVFMIHEWYIKNIKYHDTCKGYDNAASFKTLTFHLVAESQTVWDLEHLYYLWMHHKVTCQMGTSSSTSARVKHSHLLETITGFIQRLKSWNHLVQHNK